MQAADDADTLPWWAGALAAILIAAWVCVFYSWAGIAQLLVVGGLYCIWCLCWKQGPHQIQCSIQGPHHVQHKPPIDTERNPVRHPYWRFKSTTIIKTQCVYTSLCWKSSKDQVLWSHLCWQNRFMLELVKTHCVMIKFVLSEQWTSKVNTSTRTWQAWLIYTTYFFGFSEAWAWQSIGFYIVHESLLLLSITSLYYLARPKPNI